MTSNLLRTLEAVEANPQHWDQWYWHCGSSHCFMGFAEQLRLNRTAGDGCEDADVDVARSCPNQTARRLLSRSDTRDWLGISNHRWDELCSSENTLDDLRRIVAEIEAESSRA